MRKKILFLFPYKFTEFEYYRFELSKLEKKYNSKVIIHDLSNLLNSKKFNEVWKTKLEKKTLKFSSLISWIFYFNKIKKGKIIVFNHLGTSNLNSFIINLLIRLSKLPVVLFEELTLPNPKRKKNINFFLSKIKEHTFNYKVYLYYLKIYIYTFLVNFVKYDRVFLFSNKSYKKNYNKKNFFIKNYNAIDFSNALLINRNKKKFFKDYIIYLDPGSPYFTGDTYDKGNLLPKYDIKKWYNDLNQFFDKLEKFFDAKVIVIPHPKYKSSNTKKIKSFNPYYKNRIVNNECDSLAKLSTDCLFFVSQGSTAAAYAIIYFKPIINIYSSQALFSSAEMHSILVQSKSIGTKPIDISVFDKKKIIKNLKVNKLKYKNYKYKYLTPKHKKLEKIANYKIIGDFINKHF